MRWLGEDWRVWYVPPTRIIMAANLWLALARGRGCESFEVMQQSCEVVLSSLVLATNRALAAADEEVIKCPWDLQCVL